MTWSYYSLKTVVFMTIKTYPAMWACLAATAAGYLGWFSAATDGPEQAKNVMCLQFHIT